MGLRQIISLFLDLYHQAITIKEANLRYRDIMKNVVIKLASVVLLLFVGKGVGYAQYDPLFLQYKEVLPYFNPAAVGESQDMSIVSLYNKQWLGIQGAPSQLAVLLDAPWQIDRFHVGLGIGVASQKKGLYSNTEIKLSAASKWKIARGILSAGVQAGLFNSVFDGTKVKLLDAEGLTTNDPAIPLTSVSGKTFDLGAGVLYSHPKYSVGIGARHILPAAVELSSNYYLQLPFALNFIGEYNIISETSLLSWHPRVFAVSDFHSYRLDLNLDVEYAKNLRLGVMFRPMNAAGIRMGFKWGQFRLGYAFDMPITELAKNNWGSHEVVLYYSLPLSKGKGKSFSKQSIWLL